MIQKIHFISEFLKINGKFQNMMKESGIPSDFIILRHTWYNEKDDRDAQYYHRFITLDKNWNIINISEKFFTNIKR